MWKDQKVTDYGLNQSKYPDTVFIGMSGEPVPVELSLADWQGTDYVDADGILKPGTPVAKPTNAKGIPVATGGKVFGVLEHATKIADGNTVGDLTGTFQVVFKTGGTINTGLVKTSIGRDYDADELAAFTGTPFTLSGGRTNAGGGVVNAA